MRFAVVTVFAALVLSAAAPARAQTAADFELMMQWMAGRFDNNQQVFEQREAKAARIHDHLHAVVARVQVPAVGTHVFYQQQHSPDDPSKPGRQRLYSFAQDSGAGTITQRWYSFPDPAAVIDAHRDPSKLAGLTPDKLGTTPGCELIWTRDGDAFVGAMKPGACRSTSRSTGRSILVSATYRLMKDALWMSERIEDESGALLSEPPGNVPFKLLRVREFDCWAAVPGTASADLVPVRSLVLHDQGQVLPLVPPGGAEARYSIELAQLRYQNQVAVLKFAVYERGKPEAIAYSWAEPEATKIGINLRYMQSGCSVK